MPLHGVVYEAVIQKGQVVVVFDRSAAGGGRRAVQNVFAVAGEAGEDFVVVCEWVHTHAAAVAEYQLLLTPVAQTQVRHFQLDLSQCTHSSFALLSLDTTRSLSVHLVTKETSPFWRSLESVGEGWVWCGKAVWMTEERDLPTFALQRQSDAKQYAKTSYSSLWIYSLIWKGDPLYIYTCLKGVTSWEKTNISFIF